MRRNRILGRAAAPIYPIISLDGRRIGDGVPGPVCRAILPGLQCLTLFNSYGVSPDATNKSNGLGGLIAGSNFIFIYMPVPGFFVTLSRVYWLKCQLVELVWRVTVPGFFLPFGCNQSGKMYLGGQNLRRPKLVTCFGQGDTTLFDQRKGG